MLFELYCKEKALEKAQRDAEMKTEDHVEEAKENEINDKWSTSIKNLEIWHQ